MDVYRDEMEYHSAFQKSEVMPFMAIQIELEVVLSEEPDKTLSQAVSYIKTKLDVQFPPTTCQKLFKVNDKFKLPIFYDKYVAPEVVTDVLR